MQKQQFGEYLAHLEKQSNTLGVVPDIRLPSILDGTGIAELNEPFSLSPKILDRTLSFTPEPKLPIQSLQENSKNRLEKKQNFSSIVKIANMIEESIKNEKLIEELTWEIYCKKQQEMEKTYETINTESKKALFKVNVPTRDLERTKIDLLWNKLNEKLFDRISKDVYIEESLEILNNLNE